jgi:CRISPR type III-B/RAMP module RAMP protein Cmr1
MAWTTLTMQVTTPLFNGGADAGGSQEVRPSDETGVRAASIRGAMRFWFRALVGPITGPDLKLLADLERRVFGGMAEQGRGGTAAIASPVLVRISEQPQVTQPTGPHKFLPGRAVSLRDRREDDGRWIIYLMG